jgi:hypothetical protein
MEMQNTFEEPGTVEPKPRFHFELDQKVKLKDGEKVKAG